MTQVIPQAVQYSSLLDSTVFITGGASGIGAKLVEDFVAQGARVGFVDIDEAAAQALIENLRQHHDPRHLPKFIACNITDVTALQHAIAAVRGQFGPIGVLLNNAANDKRHSVEATTSASWDAGIAINLKPQFFAAQAVLEDMKILGGGSIVNFGSISWMLKQGGMPVYTTSKAAILGLTRSLARDFGPYRIRVNSLAPGWVMTEKQIALWVDEQAREEIAKGQCINQPLMPEHISQMALFLASDQSRMCTAQQFIVDGGWV
jgi:D-xylose 1-dehydrogenase